ncbi:ABC transporter G family member 23 [Daktulosphaira vitifoliae]|uniref:ABC transporter G family member 23 n=1 Tax=Daktulosphaira vitifoliae TaxID=58002 RepID=UPI0021A9961D|nr:ABC transporter G family member 23 [Daktulosphaira vitifoliae]XP_050536010.1 ABC transporter G family member 23 [Daktulosphaira vitifoliae]XP_050536011.1 ABC transporter G family member 23 [Daktulosphaira vitifoliae]XP_050536012.1 ABC transporter G family member 23 [Daktulosphaira vitifoliae]
MRPEIPMGLTERRPPLESQQSTVWTRRQQAVCVRRAYKKYGQSSNPHVILDGLNMTVPKGCIYGLLGASGCGKTTLLSCIVGRRRLNAGEIWVLGGKPGSAGSGVPGPRIGYMPQEIALYGEFTIRETMQFFGMVNDMKSKEVDEQLDFLLKFLQLPSASRAVKNLSGGQQRRVSFAAALLHSPELLILDEPTVGVDPVLRQSIWDHLVHLAKDLGTTVIITTHYIDETRQAHMIGLMRGGKFLAEESPTVLLQKYNCQSLEDVFLKLSVIQNRGKRRRSSILHDITAAITVPESSPAPAVESLNSICDNTSEMSGEFGDSISPVPLSKRMSICSGHVNNTELELPPEANIQMSFFERCKIFKAHHMRALIWKNFLWMWRNVAVMMFIVGLPVAQIVLFCLSIGKDPYGLHLAVVNYETPNKTCGPTGGCHLEELSCQFLHHVEKRRQVLDFFKDEESAFHAVKLGKAWGALMFTSNYTSSLKTRIEQGQSAQDWILDDSCVSVWLDESNQQISVLLRRDILLAFQDFAATLATACNYSTKAVDVPIRFHHPIYGPVVPNFTDFAAPGVILTIIFFLAVALTSGAMLLERNEGILERSLVSGITGIEVLLGHVVCQLMIMVFQSLMVIAFALIVFDITNEGDVLWISTLTILTGLCGMCFGFVVSCVTDNERNATYLAMGSFLPIVMLCGIIWPVEGMHAVMKTISFFLPLTQSTESMRSMLARGWPITEPTVYIGFCSTLIWITIFLTSSVLLIKFKKG